MSYNNLSWKTGSPSRTEPATIRLTVSCRYATGLDNSSKPTRDTPMVCLRYAALSNNVLDKG